MNHAAILALVADLYAQIVQLQEEKTVLARQNEALHKLVAPNVGNEPEPA